MLKAEATGQSVVVQEDTSSTSQTSALPDGTFEMVSYMRPVRTFSNGGWVPIDTSLAPNRDGTLSPVASTLNVAFSGGGTGPLVRVIADDGASLSYTWPAPLPAPTVSGSSATYPSVLPDTDLVVTAGPDNYSEVLVVKSAAAAANPALAALKFTVQGQGVNLVVNPAGQVDAVDPDGNVVLHGGVPQMWDSTIDSHVGPIPSDTDSGSGQLNKLAAAVSATRMATADPGGGPAATSVATLTVTPPAADLVGPTVNYPLFIDPSISKAVVDWADVQNNGVTGFDDPTGFSDLKVGLCDFTGCNGSWVSRAYFNFNTTSINQHNGFSAHIFAASVTATQIHSAIACDSEPVKLYTSNGISASTNWPGPAASYLESQSSADGSGCAGSPPNTVTFQGTNVVNYVQNAANANTSSMTFALIANSESSDTYWKRFAITGGAAPQLDVKFSFPPSVPVNLGINANVTCGGVHYATSSNPTLQASDQDNNSPTLQVAIKFVVQQGGVTKWQSSSPAIANSGATATASPALGDGSYTYFVTASNVPTSSGDGTSSLPASAASASYNYTIDTHGPGTTPTASSLDYPNSYWGAPAGRGDITLDDNGATAAVAFAYSWDSAANIPNPTATTCSYNQAIGNGGFVPDVGGTADLTPPASLGAGPHTLYFRTFDAAHNPSPGYGTYSTYLSPTYAGFNSPYRFEFENLDQKTPPSSSPSSYPVVNPASTTCTTATTAGSQIYDEPIPGESNNDGEHLLANCADPAHPMTFFFQLPVISFEADYAFGLDLYKANHFGKYQIGLYYDGSVHYFDDSAGNPIEINAYSGATVRQFQPLGGMHVKPGTTYWIALQPVDKDNSSQNSTNTHVSPSVQDHGYSLHVDDFEMVPINNVTVASFTAGMNNNAISTDNVASGANIGPSASLSSFSANAMATLGITPGHAFTDGGVTFNMPTANAAGDDNMVAIGQTFPVPWTPAPNINNIDLLVAASCQSSGSPSGLFVYLGYDPAESMTTPSGNQLPVIPDWEAGNTQTLTSTNGPDDPLTGAHRQNTITRVGPMTYVNSGASSTKDATKNASIYHVKLPVAWPMYTVNRLVLPNTGANFKDCLPSIHVLAVSHS